MLNQITFKCYEHFEPAPQETKKALTFKLKCLTNLNMGGAQQNQVTLYATQL